MSELDFKALELKVNQLIDACRQLKEQNQALVKENNSFKAERSQIIKQKDLARQKVEGMITRLKAMEH